MTRHYNVKTRQWEQGLQVTESRFSPTGNPIIDEINRRRAFQSNCNEPMVFYDTTTGIFFDEVQEEFLTGSDVGLSFGGGRVVYLLDNSYVENLCLFFNAMINKDWGFEDNAYEFEITEKGLYIKGGAEVYSPFVNSGGRLSFYDSEHKAPDSFIAELFLEPAFPFE